MVVLEGSHDVSEVGDDDIRASIIALVAGGVSTRDAVTYVEERFGVAHRRVYQLALELRADGKA